MTAPFTHIGVMTVEVVTGLNPRAGAIYLDGTFGRGGWTRALLAAAPCTVIAIDRDEEAAVAAAEVAAEAAAVAASAAEAVVSLARA